MKLISKIKASVLSFVLATGLMLSPAALAFAAEGDVALPDTSGASSDSQPTDEIPEPDYTATWTVTFDGSKMISDDHEYNQVISGMQPGDTARFEITLDNKCDKEVDWYVKNWIADSMEQGAWEGNEGAAYNYSLVYYTENESMDDPNAGTVIYSNSQVGGEEDDSAIEPNAQRVSAMPSTDSSAQEATSGGLLNATANNGMKDYFHLGTFAPNAVRHMVLTMGIDGETHTNGYFDTNAGAWLQYAAEPVGQGEEIVTTERTTTYEQVPRTVGGDLPQTGDMLPTISMICLVLGLIVLACGIASWMNDRRHAKEGE